MWEVFQVKFWELASRFDLVLMQHILKWRKSVLLWPSSVSTCCVTVVHSPRLQRREVTQSSLASQPFRDSRRIVRPFCMCINNVSRTCKLMTATLKDLTRKAAHHLVVNLFLLYHTCKRRESTCVGNRRIHEKQMEVLEMAGREGRN